MQRQAIPDTGQGHAQRPVGRAGPAGQVRWRAATDWVARLLAGGTFQLRSRQTRGNRSRNGFDSSFLRGDVVGRYVLHGHIDSWRPASALFQSAGEIRRTPLAHQVLRWTVGSRPPLLVGFTLRLHVLQGVSSPAVRGPRQQQGRVGVPAPARAPGRRRHRFAGRSAAAASTPLPPRARASVGWRRQGWLNLSGVLAFGAVSTTTWTSPRLLQRWEMAWDSVSRLSH